MRARGLSGVAALVLLAGCGETAAPRAGLDVVASFYPIVEFTRAVAGERARVSALVPPGVEPHDWDPSPPDLARVEKARVLVYNGAGLEPWVDKLPRGRGLVVVKAVEGLPIRDAGGAPDPHVWLDPVLAQAMVDNIRAGLAVADPAGAAAFEANAQALKGRLAALHQQHEAGLRTCARRDVVTTHSAFGYLARRYGLSVVPLAGVAPESEPSPARLAAIVRFARERKVKYIFLETLVSPRLAETLAREVGARTLVFNPIEGVTREQAASATYFTLMEANLANLRVALECS